MVAVDEAVPRNDYVKFRMEHLYKYNDLRRGLSLFQSSPTSRYTFQNPIRTFYLTKWIFSGASPGI